MEYWLSANWFSVVQTVGIVGGYVFTNRSARKDDRSRQISNLIALNERYIRIWGEYFTEPKLGRLLKKDVDLENSPVTIEEQQFVKMLMLHLDTVRRATDAGMLIKIEGIQDDVRDFMSCPIPKDVWSKMKAFHDKEFVQFVDEALK